jgi:hypothetical protein
MSKLKIKRLFIGQQYTPYLLYLDINIRQLRDLFEKKTF